jgi:hypothetical protein
MTQSEMSKSRRRLCRSEFSRLNRICMLDRVKFQQHHVALHAYFAYFRIRLHMHESVNMRITIVLFFDQSCEQNENNISR